MNGGRLPAKISDSVGILRTNDVAAPDNTIAGVWVGARCAAPRRHRARDRKPAVPRRHSACRACFSVKLVTLDAARARIIGIDLTEARSVPGVIAIITADDLRNRFRVSARSTRTGQSSLSARLNITASRGCSSGGVERGG